MKEYKTEDQLYNDYLDYLLENTINAKFQWKDIKDENFINYIRGQYNLENINLIKGIYEQINGKTLCTYLIESDEKRQNIILQYSSANGKKVSYENLSNIDKSKTAEIFKMLKLNYKDINKFIADIIEKNFKIPEGLKEKEESEEE